MRKSKSFRRKKEKNELLLYFVSIISLVQIFYLVINKKYKSFLFFCIIGAVLHCFIKNISIVLILDIIITNILMKTFIKREGMEGATGPQGLTGSEEMGASGPTPADEGFDKMKSKPSEAKSNLEQVTGALDKMESLMNKFTKMSSNLGIGK